MRTMVIGKQSQIKEIRPLFEEDTNRRLIGLFADYAFGDSPDEYAGFCIDLAPEFRVDANSVYTGNKIDKMPESAKTVSGWVEIFVDNGNIVMSFVNQETKEPGSGLPVKYSVDEL